jgi:hypothetical protein
MQTIQILPLSEIIAARPGIPAAVVYYITRQCCTGHPIDVAGIGHRRPMAYDLTEVDKEIKQWKKQKRPSNCLKFVERGVTWVAADPQGRLVDSDGIHRETADRMYRDKKIGKPRIEATEGPTPWYRKFWPQADVLAVAAEYSKPATERNAVRSPTELASLNDNDYVNAAEAEPMGGFSRYYLRAHSDTPDPRRKAAPTPAEPVGSLIRGKLRERISARGHRVTEPVYRIGDLREILSKRDNPPVPEGAVLVRDAIPKLKAIGIVISRATLMQMITDGRIKGGAVESFKKNFSPEKMAWMLWDDRKKLPGAPQSLEPVHNKLDAIHEHVVATRGGVENLTVRHNELHGKVDARSAKDDAQHAELVKGNQRLTPLGLTAFPDRGMKVRHLASALEVSPDFIGQYRKRARVAAPPQGKREYLHSRDDCRLILEKIINVCPTASTVQRAQQLLSTILTHK